MREQDTDTRYKNKWLVISAVGTGVFLATVDGSIVNVSLPTMVTSLNTNFAVIQWVVLAYLLTVTTLMLGFGRLGDIFGKKRIYLTGFVLFTMASAACGFAPNVYWLIGARIIQGIGSAMTMALGPAITTEAFPPYERGKAMGIIGAVVSIGIVTGPALGGLINDLLSWHWIFFVNIPAGIVGAWMVRRYIPKFIPSKKQRFDYMGAILLFTALFCLLIGLSVGQQKGFGDSLVLVLLPAFFLFMIGFIFVEARVVQPMIQLRLFMNPLLCVNLVTGLMSFIALGGIVILIPFYLNVTLGYPPVKVGLMMCVVPVLMGLFAPMSGALSDRLGSRPITLLGLIVLCLSYLSASTLTTHTDEWGYIVRMMGIGIGTGLFLSPNNSAIMGAGPQNQLGIVSGLMAISRTLGQTIGVSVISALWTVRIRLLTGNWELDDVTQAPLTAQVHGLQFIFCLVALMILTGVFLSIYGYILEKQK